jgi:hypothetical protein
MAPGRILSLRLEELRPHPSYARLQFVPSCSKLSALAEQGELAFRDPLVITQDRIIVDGYARWELARLQGRASLPCLERGLSEEEALCRLVLGQSRANGLNDFCRILLALELAGSLREKALSNQRTGGQYKGLSKLSEARIFVRSEIARIANVSEGNVEKVRRLLPTVESEVLRSLREGDVRINRAAKWSTSSPEKQRMELSRYLAFRGSVKRFGSSFRSTSSQCQSRSLIGTVYSNAWRTSGQANSHRLIVSSSRVGAKPWS